MRLRRICRWLGIGLGTFVVLSTAATLLIRHWWLQDQAANRRNEFTIVAAEKGWKDCESLAVQDLLKQHPGELLPLLASPDPDTREAAFDCLPRVAENLSAAQLDEVGPLLDSAQRWERRIVLRTLREAKTPGLGRVAARLERPQTIDGATYYDFAVTLSEFEDPGRLLRLASRRDIPAPNRQAAVAALGVAGKPAVETIATLERLSAEEPALFASVARIALSRIRGTADPERLREDRMIERIGYGTFYHRELPNPVDPLEAARVMADELRKDLRPLQYPEVETGQETAIKLAQIGCREAIPDLIAATRDPSDWRFVAGACEALGRLEATEAEPALRAVADHHWNTKVRTSAQQAIDGLHGRHPYTPPRVAGPRCLEIDWPDHFGGGEKSSPPDRGPLLILWQRVTWKIEDWIEIARVTIIRRLSPKVGRVKVQTTDREELSTHWTLLPTQRIRFAGGTLLGYDSGYSGTGLVFVSKSGEARLLPIDRVTQLARWNDGVIVVTCSAMVGNSMLHLVREGPNGTVDVTPFRRLPDMYEQCERESDGSLLFGRHLRLTATGELQSVR